MRKFFLAYLSPRVFLNPSFQMPERPSLVALTDVEKVIHKLLMGKKEDTVNGMSLPIARMMGKDGQR